MNLSSLVKGLAVAAIVIVGQGAACSTTGYQAKINAATEARLPDVPKQYRKDCPLPPKKIAGKHYKSLYAGALVWGTCERRRSRGILRFIDRLREGGF